MSLAERAELLKAKKPDLVADVVLYATADGGKKLPALPGWGCVCAMPKHIHHHGFDAWMQLGDEPLRPGEGRRVGMVFLTAEGADAARRAGHFRLWEGGIIGEASVAAEGRETEQTA